MYTKSVIVGPKTFKMKIVLIAAFLLGATCFVHSFPGDKMRKSEVEISSNDHEMNTRSNEIGVVHYTRNRNPIFKSNETDENLSKLIDLIVKLSEADCFKDDGGLNRSKRGIWQDTIDKVKETYNTVADKVKESAKKVKDKFHETFVESKIKEKIQDFIERVGREFNVENMCRNVKKLQNVLRRYPIDDKVTTLVSFLDIIFCELSKDSDAGFKELMENPKYERLITEKDAATDYEKLMKYIERLDKEENPEVPADMLKSSSASASVKTTLIYILGSVIAVKNVAQYC